MRRLLIGLFVACVIAACGAAAPVIPTPSPLPVPTPAPTPAPTPQVPVPDVTFRLEPGQAVVTSPDNAAYLCISAPGQDFANKAPGSYVTVCRPMLSWVSLRSGQ